MKNEELVRLIQQGHSEYMEQLWQQNKGFIRREAIRYAGVDTKREVEDLEQEGAIGLMRATETFDLSSGFSFLTYAGYWIKQSMRRYLTGGRRREDVIADATSLDIQTAPDNDTTVLETLEDENNISPEKSAVDNDTLQLVKRKIGSLPDIQRRILTGVCMYGRSIRSMSVDLGLDEQKTKRQLWEQHVYWTRFFIISTAADLGDLDAVTQRLLRNPKDFAKVLAEFYGAMPAMEFEELLTQHLMIGGQLVNAAREHDNVKADELRGEWYQNADEIAAFLAYLNPYWDQKTWQTMLYDHLSMTEQEAALRLQGDYAQDIQVFDKIEEETLAMADYMFQGIREHCLRR